MPSSGVSKMMKVAVLALAQLAQKLVVHHDLRHAAVGQASDETGAADIDIVELEAEAGGQKHAERRHHPHQLALLVGGLEHDDGQAGIGAVLGYHALDQGALLACAPGGVSQRICQSPWTERTAPWALAAAVRPSQQQDGQTAAQPAIAANGSRRRAALLVGCFEGPIRVDPLIFLGISRPSRRDPTDTAMTAP